MYSANDGVWKDAGELTTVDAVLDLDGALVGIEELQYVTENTTVFNISVDRVHTYFVGSGRVLGHNCSFVQLTAKNGTKLGQQIGRWRREKGGQGGAKEFLDYASNLATEARKAGSFVTGEVGRGPGALGKATIYRRGDEFIVEQDGMIMSYVVDNGKGGIVDEFVRLGGTL